MKRFDLAKIYFRSFLLLGSLNFRRMQNIGFAFTLVPLLRGETARRADNERGAFLMRHTKIFSTHPAMSGALIGSVVKIEEDFAGKGGLAEQKAVQLKNTMMGPYAAIGDTFFSGSLRPLAAVLSVACALAGSGWAPFVFLIVYEPLQLWIRTKGFYEGYRLGQEGFRFIQMVNLPGANARIRWLTVACLALLLAWWITMMKPVPLKNVSGLIVGPVMLAAILVFMQALGRRVPSVILIYVMAVVFFVISI